MRRISIKAARVASNMTQAELAEKMGVNRRTVLCWERGKQRMSKPNVIAFCAITGFSEDEIFLPETNAPCVEHAS